MVAKSLEICYYIVIHFEYFAVIVNNQLQCLIYFLSRILTYIRESFNNGNVDYKILEGVDYFMWYEYKGNQFKIADRNEWYHKGKEYKITDLKVNNPVLCLPPVYCGKPVSLWCEEDRNILKDRNLSIEELHIPCSMKNLDMEYKFPMLQKVKVESGHEVFSTDGKMLFSADGKELLHCLAAGNQEIARVPKHVKKIERHAFKKSSCETIIFENQDVTADKYAFENSRWLEAQGDFCIVGNMFFSLRRSIEKLSVPEGIRRFHEDAFSMYSPLHLKTPLMPPRSCIADLCGDNYYTSKQTCKELTLTSPAAVIRLNALRRFKGLRSVHITPAHKKYCSENGVVFSKNKKYLIYYPCSKPDIKYIIPEGVVKIGRMAFFGQVYLEEVKMPDTVKMLGMGAFCSCKSLQKIHFSENLKEIPDDSAYQKGGVFENCTSLKKVILPSKLQYLGNHAFFASGLEHITLNQKLRQIGEYALAASNLKEFTLPASLERVGQGALFYATQVHAYIGTAKGLISAVNTVASGDSEKSANVQWSRCMVYAHHKNGNKAEKFLIPGSLKRSGACHMDMAWNNDEIDYEEYDACFEFITDGDERLEFAQLGILRHLEDEDNPYVAYMKHSALKVATHLIEEKKEKEFLTFLRKGYLSDNALDKLLKLANKNNLTTSSSYILDYQNKQGGSKKKRFVL